MTATIAVTNYGVKLEKETLGVYSVIGEVTSLDFPELINPAIEATNHQSGGYREYVSSKLVEVSEFKATVNYVANVTISGMLTDLTGGTARNYKFTFPTSPASVWTVSALVTSLKPGSADAQGPEAMSAEVTFQPTGTATFA
jgi:hypothetical protein